MTYEHLLVEISAEDHLGEITLNRPAKLNTFNRPLAQELSRALQELDDSTAVRVIMLKGAGKAFCAGIDLGDFAGKSASGYREWIECMEAPLVLISHLKTPVIAQVHGVAAANGAGLVAAADLAIAAEDARIGLTAINVGLNCIGPVVAVTRSVGRKRALEMLLSGKLVEAPDALTMGLVNRLAPPDQLNEAAREWAAELAQKSPVAAQLAKHAFYTAEDMEYDTAFAYMNEAFARLCTTEDAREGVSAFLEKRPPVWQEQ